MKRIVEPELLDCLPADDPEAIGSRRDLVKLNRCMGHARIMARALRRTIDGSTCITELGAGDGIFLLSVARKIARPQEPMAATLLDRQELVSAETRVALISLGWRVDTIRGDVTEWLQGGGGNGTMIANLFLHHFNAEPLAELFQLIARQADVFVAVEPRRAAWPWFCSRLLRGIGCNRVTRHDAPVSVHAGFAGNELTQLWPDQKNWRLVERPAGLFSHLFIAQRVK